MDPSPYFSKPLAKYSTKHLPLRVYILITQSGLTKSQFFKRYPDFNHNIDSFPKILLDQIRERKRMKKERLRQAHRDLARNIERLSLRSPKRLEKLRKKVEFLPSTSQVVRPVAKVKPVALSFSPYHIIDIESDNEPMEVPRVDNPPSVMELLPQPSVEAIPHNWEDFQPPSIQEIPPPSIQEIPPPSPAPDVELIPPPSVEIIPQVE